MLALTPNAVEAIRTIVGPDAPAGAGLRISSDGATLEDAEFELGVEDEPSAGDVVLAEEGVRVFVEPHAATLLAGMLLDAEGHEDHFHFSLAPQEE